MYLGIRNPWGQVTSLDLGGILAWRIGLGAIKAPHERDPEQPPTWLAVVISYVVAGVPTPYQAPIAALNLKGTQKEAQTIADVGLPKGDRNGNKDRLRESAKILINSMTQGDVESINERLGGLVDTYYDFLEAVAFLPKGPSRMVDVGGGVKEFDGWQWSITGERFDAWMKPKGALFVPAGSNIGAPPPGGGGQEMLPPPGADAGSHPPPGTLPSGAQKRPTREQRRAGLPPLPSGVSTMGPLGDPPASATVAPMTPLSAVGLTPLTSVDGEPEELKPE